MDYEKMLLTATILMPLVAYLFVRGRKAKKNLEQSKDPLLENPYAETTISLFVKENMHKGPWWLPIFHNFSIGFAVAGTIGGICGFFVFAAISVFDLDPKWLPHHTMSTDMYCIVWATVLVVYTSALHPTLVGIIHDRVFRKVLPGYAAVSKSYFEEMERKRARNEARGR